jgi:hypothetical protein
MLGRPYGHVREPTWEPTGRTTSRASRTSTDKWLAIIPGRELIRTMLNAIQVTTDQKAGGSNPSERAPVSAGQGLDIQLAWVLDRAQDPVLSHVCHAALKISPSAVLITARSDGEAWV